MPVRTEVAQETLERARARGASAAEAMLVEGDSFDVVVRLGEVDVVTSARQQRLGLRVFFGRRAATTATSDVSAASLDKLVDDTCALARAAAEDPYAGLPDAEALAKYLPDLDLYDGDGEAMRTEDRIALARRAEEAALRTDPRIQNSEGAEFATGFGRVAYANSLGFAGEYRGSSYSLSVSPIAQDASGMQRDYWYTVSRKFRELEDAAAVGRRAAARAVRRLGARKVPTQQVPVVFDQETAAGLLRTLVSAASGYAVYKNASFLLGRLGQQIAAGGFTVVDDGTLPGALGSRPFDGEGLATRRTVVVEDGVLRTYLLDTYSARKLGLRSTGNASRDVGDAPGVAPTNLWLQPGTAPPDEIIRSVRCGLYVTEMLGSGVNVVTGDYSRGATGIWIENGALAYPVEEITVAGNLKDMLLAVEAVGNDLEWRGRIAAPTILIGRMTVAGS
jgi:PmbA protein